MLPAFIMDLYAEYQELLWLSIVLIDLLLTLALYRLFGKMGLYSVIVLNILLCNLLGPKITTIFGISTSMGVILYSGIYFATDLLSERYGKREAGRAVMLGFTASVIAVFMGLLSLEFLPTNVSPEQEEWSINVHESLTVLFGVTPRFVFGSLLAYLISQTHDVWMFHLLKEKTKGRHLWLRNCVSTLSSQAIDTVVYGLVVWWAVFDLATAMQLAAGKYVIKFIIAALDTPFIYWARTWDLRHKDWHEAEAVTHRE